MNNQWVMIVSILALVFSILSMVIGVVSLAYIIGIEKSTHSVQLMPVDPEIDKMNQQFMKEVNTDPWATTDEAIEKQGKVFKEDLEDNMPEFYEEDKELISY